MLLEYNEIVNKLILVKCFIMQPRTSYEVAFTYNGLSESCMCVTLQVLLLLKYIFSNETKYAILMFVLTIFQTSLLIGIYCIVFVNLGLVVYE